MKKLAILLLVIAIIFGCSNPNRKNEAAKTAAAILGLAADITALVVLGENTNFSQYNNDVFTSDVIGTVVEAVSYEVLSADYDQVGTISGETIEMPIQYNSSNIELPTNYNASNIDSCNILARKDNVDVYGGNYIVRWHDCDENGKVDYKSYATQDINNLKVLYVENIHPLKRHQADSQQNLAGAISEESIEVPVHYNSSNIDSCTILDRMDDVDVYGGNYIVRWHDCDDNAEIDYKSYATQDISNLKVLHVENLRPLKKPQADSQQNLAGAISEESIEVPVHYNSLNIDSCTILYREDDVEVYGGNYIVRWHDCDDNRIADHKSFATQDMSNLKVLYVEKHNL